MFNRPPTHGNPDSPSRPVAEKPGAQCLPPLAAGALLEACVIMGVGQKVQIKTALLDSA